MANLQAGRVHTDSGAKPIPHENGDVSSSRATDNTANEATEMSGRADSSFWLTTLGPLGSVRYVLKHVIEMGTNCDIC
jgi:hypothetical protein